MQRKPRLQDELYEYVQAFGVLSRVRHVGVALGPVPLTEMEAYCRMFEVEDIEMFVRCISAMDAAYLQVHSKRHDK